MAVEAARERARQRRHRAAARSTCSSLSTASPDYLLPPLVTFVQEALGLERCATVELRSGCAGAVRGARRRPALLERGQYKTAVVIGSEAISPLLVPVFLGKEPDADPDARPHEPVQLRRRRGRVVLQATTGTDGASSVRRSPASAGLEEARHADHRRRHARSRSTSSCEAKRLVELKVDVVESGRFTPYVLTEALTEVLKASGVTGRRHRRLRDPRGQRGLHGRGARGGRAADAEWLALEGKIVENLDAGRRHRLRRRAARARRRVEDGRVSSRATP